MVCIDLGIEFGVSVWDRVCFWVYLVEGRCEMSIGNFLCCRWNGSWVGEWGGSSFMVEKYRWESKGDGKDNELFWRGDFGVEFK